MYRSSLLFCLLLACADLPAPTPDCADLTVPAPANPDLAVATPNLGAASTSKLVLGHDYDLYFTGNRADELDSKIAAWTFPGCTVTVYGWNGAGPGRLRLQLAVTDIGGRPAASCGAQAHLRDGSVVEVPFAFQAEL